eukprot:TRINITY_DN9089_c0_g1_i2.p1 TRINITY_DN9089_c0_g1~~TRINITY_DN9089_c0_g1_i2.p1  ORF type:complete len:186 (-),score=45.90 TRINITY_DN9089_c0_g1_i2:34-591(-)
MIIYDLIQSLSGNSFEMTKSGFDSFLKQYFPFWTSHVAKTPDLSVLIWEWTSQGKVSITIDETVASLNLLEKSSLAERWNISSKFYDTNRTGKLTFDQLVQSLDLLLKLYNINNPDVQIQDFVSMLYEKLCQPTSHPLPLETIEEEIIKKPLFSELFQIAPRASKKLKRPLQPQKNFSISGKLIL